MRFSFVFLLIFLNLSPSQASSSQFHRIEKSNEQFLVVQFDFPDLEIQKNSQKSGEVLITIPGLLHNYLDGLPLLPVYSTSIVAPPDGEVSWQIIDSEKQSFPNYFPAKYFSKDTENSPALNTTFNGSFPDQLLRLEDVGLFRDYRIMGLQFYPAQVTPGGIIFYKSVKIKIQFPATNQQSFNLISSKESAIFDNFALNAVSVNKIPPQVPQAPLPSGPLQGGASYDRRVKLILDRKGIYKVSGQDLLNAEVDISNINPQTFRLTNKGNDVAIYVAGDADQRLDPADYIEFLGERNEKTFLNLYPDLYTDPFSNNNVYWLSWGESPGIRMVEESGSVITTNPSEFNFAQFYPYTIHAERDAHFERFGEGNTGRLSYTRDSWFYDSGIQSISKRSYPVALVYPDSASFTPVNIKVALAGKSPSNHQVMAWINQRLIGQVSGNWYGQRTYLLDNFASSSIRTLDLMHGNNSVEIQLPALASNGTSDWVMLNWIDITYDKQYKADNNFLEFGKPSPSVIFYPNIDLFLFELTNFTRPDIEIYKKGISKIVNYALEVEGAGSSLRYKILFQDNIFSDNVEYIAVASNAKLSPKAIVKDEPYDPNNPFASLKDQTNSADYLIITHQKFYDRAGDLVELRRNRGLKPILVDVQDIYDEFNHGIKSPLAIKDFLRYAFYNWDRSSRLKYVLLLGDANYNYKLTGSLQEDYVPTLFYQSIEFGAVATDLPYALVAGNDILPDLFVGRVPVTTNGEVVNFLEKIRDHEESPVIGPWRNQSLFISGNDRSTPEFPLLSGYSKKPAFRSQNQRVIDLLLDKNYSAFKLNTIKNDNLQFDPNFGGTTDLIDYFDNGLSLVNFLGHGGGGIWADVQLLNLQDVDRLNNKGMYPFITSMTCFTGAFDNPGSPGLAQRFLLAPDRGAIGIFASSGLGWLSNDYSMLWNVLQNFSDNSKTIGEIITLGKIDYFINSQYVLSDTIVPGYLWGHSSLKYDMVYEYNLIGDPYIFIGKPSGNIQVTVNNDLPLWGDTITATIEAPFSAAEGYLELSNGDNDIVFREPILYAGNPVSRTIPIPTDSIRGTGIVRAYLSDNTNDAVGTKELGINYTLFDSIQINPVQPNAEDSVSITVRAKDILGIMDVRIIAILPKGVVPNDTVHLSTTQIGPQRFQTIGHIPAARSPSTVYFFAYATNSSGQQSRMNFNYQVKETRPDPFIYENSMRLTGEDQVKLALTIGNNGQVSGQNIQLKLYNGYDNFRINNAFANEIINVDGRDSIITAVNFSFPLDTPGYRIYAALDPDQQSPDFNRENNIDSTNITINIFNLTPALGSTYQMVQNDTLRINDLHTYWLGPNSITQNSALVLQLEVLSENLQRERLFPIKFEQSDNPEFLDIIKTSGSASFTTPYHLKLFVDGNYILSNGYNLGDVRLYRWDGRMNDWLQQDAYVDTNRITLEAELTIDGRFAPFISTDKKAPQIKLTIDGQRIRSNSLVSPAPVLNILIEDESGININRDQIFIAINDVALPQEKVLIPDSVQQSNVLGITAYPELNTGQHQLTIEAKDVNGNLSRQNYVLQVSTEFDLHVYGNFPNPFSDQTVFSYFITNTGQIIDDLEIRIFTVSGRLIKSIKTDQNTGVPGNDPRLVGYNELIWDGRDESGNEVANGVYFALVKAKFEDKEKQQILKVAKLK